MTGRPRWTAVATTLGLVAALVVLPAATSATSPDDNCSAFGDSAPAAEGSAAARADDGRTVLIDDRPPDRAYFQLVREDAPNDPPPAVGHWNTFLPLNREVPSDPYRLLTANTDESDDAIDPPPTFQGKVVGTIKTIGVRIARGHIVNEIPAQEFLSLKIEMDGVVIADDDFPVTSDDGRLDLCHLIEYGLYYVLLKDVDVAMAIAGVPNLDTTERTVTFTFKPSGIGAEGVLPFDMYTIDSQLAPSSLEFNGGTTPGPRVSLDPNAED